jgi:putative flavoprotein involved in K+ transport
MSNADAYQRAAAWLRDLEAALARADMPAVLALFADEECFWRDMVAFTWNIKTMEGKGEIAAFLSATLASTVPSGFRIEGDARELDGVTEARLTFETKLARVATFFG